MELFMQSVHDSVRLLTTDRHGAGTMTVQALQIDRADTQTHADLVGSWPCGHTEAPAPLPWWGRPTRARAKERQVSQLDEHPQQPPTHKYKKIEIEIEIYCR